MDSQCLPNLVIRVFLNRLDSQALIVFHRLEQSRLSSGIAETAMG